MMRCGSRNCMRLIPSDDPVWKYDVVIHSYMNTEYSVKNMRAVLDLIHEYEIDFIVKETADQDKIWWIHTFLPKNWVETYSEKMHFDFWCNVPGDRR